ncbi:shikimate dehydrogenase [Chitinophagaceae bacterium IBVUCB1]|nr:shikimate dehydrogenase [Chitinophagaceae bacterium IBVUCB1]
MAASYGLIGYPLSHSFSPPYFAKKFAEQGIDADYKAYPLASIEELTALLNNNPSLQGLNVTIPYKQEVIPYLDAIDDAAKAIGAVNCITIKDGILAGYNTDWIGFTDSIHPLLQPDHTHALVLGSGGSSKAVVYALKQLGIQYNIVSRNGGNYQYSQLTESIIQAHTIIINTTPLGMYPHTDNAPDIPYQFLTTSHLLYDLVYNPAETVFMQKGILAGATVKNGYEMLVLQAEASWRIWNTNR